MCIAMNKEFDDPTRLRHSVHEFYLKSPEQMAGLAALAGAISVTAGLYGSWHFDTPAGPSIVVSAAALFALLQLFPARQ